MVIVGALGDLGSTGRDFAELRRLPVETAVLL